MKTPSPDDQKAILHISKRLQALRLFIAGLEDRGLDEIDTLLSVAQAELNRLSHDRDRDRQLPPPH